MKKSVRFSLIFMALLMLLSNFAIFAKTYQSYTYSLGGYPMASPDGYTIEKTLTYTDMGMRDDFNDPRDIFVDKNMNVYIVDGGLNKVFVFSEYLNYKFEISEFVNNEGVEDALTGPSGVFVTDKYIYVADTENNRIVLFDLKGNFVKIFEEPESVLFPEGHIYRPVALAVDNAGQMYVVSSTTYIGVIVLDKNGQFQNVIGAQSGSVGVIQLLWSSLSSGERKIRVTYTPTEYNNISIDEEGFFYVTSTSIEEGAQYGALTSKDNTYAPVKKLNASGTDILARNGFWGPYGEVQIGTYSRDASAPSGVSKIIDAAAGPYGTWSIIDERRSRVYTYDSEGNCLFIFGEKGMKKGNLQSIEGIVYQGERMLLLDKMAKSVTICNRTEYGDLLMTALEHNNERRYDLAVEDWETILQRNGNFDAAYIGIGDSYYRAGDWDNAMKYYKYAYDLNGYSEAFKLWRQDWLSKYIIVVPIVFIIVVWLGLKFFTYAAKVNKAASVKAGKKTYWEELLFGFHLIVHPFDGFWDLKHEKRGSVRAATTFIIITIAAFTYQSVGQSYLYNPNASYSSIIIQIVSIFVPIMLWVTANWCLTTLFEGEGKFKDIYIAVGYSTVPLPLFIISSTLLTHVSTASESGFISMLISFGWTWVAFLVFCGMMITHDYSLFKNFITCIGTIVGMAFIMFLAILFSTLVVKMVSFVSNIVTELTYRM